MLQYDVQAVIIFTSQVEKDAARSSDVSIVTIAHPNTKPALPLTGKRPKQQQRRRHHIDSTPFTPTRYL